MPAWQKMVSSAVVVVLPRCNRKGQYNSKLLHRSTFGKKGICPQITQMDADEDLFFSVSASICVNLPAPLAHFVVLFHSAIPDWLRLAFSMPLAHCGGKFNRSPFP